MRSFSHLTAHIIQDLGYVIKRFKFKELEAAVLPHFPEITWNQVIEKLVLIHENLSIQNAVAIIQAELNVRYAIIVFLKIFH